VTNASGKSIDLKVSSAPVTTWVGSVGGVISNQWDIATTKNWTILGTSTNYQDGAGVLFQDGAATNYIDVTTFVSPGGMLVNATTNYTFDGVGGIWGSGDLTKSGSGTLTLLTGNSYQNTTISAGTVQAGNGGYVGTLGAGNVQNDGTLVLNRADPLTIAGSISGGGSVIQAGSNTTYLSGANSYSGGTLINAGTVQITTPTALGSPAGSTPLATVASGAALDINGQYPSATNPVVVSGPGIDPTHGALFNTGGGAESHLERGCQSGKSKQFLDWYLGVPERLGPIPRHDDRRRYCGQRPYGAHRRAGRRLYWRSCLWRVPVDPWRRRRGNLQG
jgi:autotransporter-associated beta strand protein